MSMLADSSRSSSASTPTRTPTPPRSSTQPPAAWSDLTVAATPGGYQQLLELAEPPAGRRVWAIEGTGGYGAGLTRYLARHQEEVVELDRPKRAARRHGAKSDPLDADAPPARRWAATSSPSPERPGREPRCRCGWPPAARRSRPPPTPNVSCTPWSSPHPRTYADDFRIARPASWSPPAPGCGSTAELGRGDRHHRSHPAELGPSDPGADRRGHRPPPGHPGAGASLAPRPAHPPGVGPIVAATVLCAWSHPGRCRSEAAFAMLGGAAPIPASSARPSASGSIAPATASSTGPCTPWS